jgi:molybdopterin converting factor small subunit
MADVVVRIPAALRTFAGDVAELRAAAGTVREVLGELGGRHPQLLQRLLTPEGELRPFVNIYVGRASVRAMAGLATRVADGEVVTILPAVAGG